MDVALRDGFSIWDGLDGLDSDRQLRVGILGTGNVGTDLLLKVRRSRLLRCVMFAGRNINSAGMRRANQMDVPLSGRGITAITEDPSRFDLVFDATSALDAERHWALLSALGVPVIDLTPANLGELCIPALNLAERTHESNLCMVTCGGQAAIPLARCIAQTHPHVEYIEIVSTVASRGVGPATRISLDEYLITTQHAMAHFCGTARTKAILIVNPSDPPINMQCTIFAKASDVDLPLLRTAVDDMVTRVKHYVPGYRLVVAPLVEGGRIALTVQVTGAGDYLPSYAGNLDIITCAAVSAAEERARALAQRTTVPAHSHE
ncbi:MAG TPA: acetaldehyde dehydrogenase (acetylating) [Pseudonocardiaceae bacterium]|nr:acetaldehyde dehydrogenase (acetylating) [Pseudonocardiaceae bacterium]